MKHTKHNKLTALAAAVGIACGSLAIAGEDMPDAYDKQPEPTATQQQPGDENANRDMSTDRSYPDAEQSSELTYPTQPAYPNDSTDTEDSVAADSEREYTYDENRDSTYGENKDSEYRDEGDTTQARESASSYESESSSEAGKVFDESIASEHKLSKFVAAVEKVGLTDALKNGTEYTVFAPTDEAFGDDMNDVSVEELREIVRSHIVVGKVDAEQARSLDSAMVLTGETVSLSANDNKLEVGDAEVVTADIRSGNLTIHAIDAVLEPTGMSAQGDANDEQDEMDDVEEAE